MRDLSQCMWRSDDLPALIDALCRKSKILMHNAGAISPPTADTDLRIWFENAGAHLGIEIDAADLWGLDLADRLRSSAPAVVPVEGGWLALVDVRQDRATLLSPHLSRISVPLEVVRKCVARHIEQPLRTEVDALLDSCHIDSRRRERAATALLFEGSRYKLAGTLYQLRVPAGASFLGQLRQAGLATRAGVLLAAHLIEYAVWILAWYILGRDALQGHVDTGWLAAFALALATLVPFRMLTTWLQGVLAIGAGGLLRQRLLTGILKLSPEEVRHEGAGLFLARSIEAELVEALALSGGLTSALAVIEIVLAMAILAQGPSPVLQPLLLGLWTALAVWLAARYWRARARWTETRLAITHDLVERMTGHRTRIAQQAPAEWHVEEDRQIDEYTARSKAMDRTSAQLISLLPRVWMVAGIASMAPAFLGSETSPAALAISVGGIVMAWRALKRLAAGAGNLSGAAISWERISDLFRAAARPELAGSVAETRQAAESVLIAKDLGFTRNETSRVVLEGVDLDLRPGDRVLIEGESGGGKSTLVSLLAGLRDPNHGLLLSGGLDRRTLGDTLWRRRIVAAPQYHENHVLTGPFAYNLLMGRNWPAHPSEMKEAQQVCEELGLGPLLARMPGGLMQLVGETGWQLSQGERSRLFMARALLQSSEVVILDESFAALDPENLQQALECVLARANTLVVVAHP